MTIDESTYWQQRAALLDPLTYVYSEGGTITVDAGKTWFALGFWGYRDLAANRSLYHRRPDTQKPLIMPAGSVWTADAGTSSILYCKPELVVGVDGRYANGPLARALYFTRLNRLSAIAVATLTAHVVAGTGYGNSVTTNFPGDFTYGLITHVTSFDIGWTALLAASGTTAFNLDTEPSDNHQMRFTHQPMLPFARATFPSIKSHAATISGGNGVPLDGFGTVIYHKLPADW